MWCRKIVSPLVVLVLLLLSLPQPALGRQESGEVLVPKDETFALELLSPLDSKTSRKGDKFDCKVLSPVQYAGAIVSGHVRKAKSSGKANGKSEMDLAFDNITLADGRAGGFNAQVKEVNEVANAGDDGRADEEGTVKGKSRVKTSVKRAALGALAGALIGGAVAGGQGAAIGAAIGASVGVTTTLAREGPNLEFKTGTQFTVLTNAPSRRKASLEGAARQSGPPLKSATESSPPSAGNTQPSKPEPPSQSYRTYNGGDAFSLSVPDNWREFPSAGAVTFAPDGSSFNYQGRPAYTHCAMVGALPVGGRDLRQATEALVKGITQKNSYLLQQGAYVRDQFANRPALAVTLSGTWPTTGHREQVTVYTTMTRSGNLFYLFAVVPQEDAAAYQTTFLTMVRSIQLNN